MLNTNTISKTFDKSTFLSKVYGLMFLSLLLSFGTAYGARAQALESMFHVNMNMYSDMFIVAIIAEFVLVWVLAKSAITHPRAGLIGLIAFSVIDGFTMSSIFEAYPVKLIADAFLTASADFGVMSFYGLTTKKELNWGRQLFGAVIALVVVGIINLIWFNSLVMVIFSGIGVIIFSAYTAYDSQKIVEIGEHESGNDMGIAIFGALSLYLDFINLFMDLLQIFGFTSSRK